LRKSKGMQKRLKTKIIGETARKKKAAARLSLSKRVFT